MTFEEIYNKISDIIQMNQAEARKLYDCAKSLPENAVVVEIGTYQGGSAMVMAAAINGMVYTIDNDPKFETKILDNILLIKGTSEEATLAWDKPIDMLFIDGSHFYADVAKDIINWVPKVKDGGIVCFHDYGSHVDVSVAVNEALLHRVGFSDNSLLAIIK